MKEGSQPKAIRPYPVPQAYRDLVKKEVVRLIKIGLLTRVKEAEWSSPSFPIPKKNKTIRFVTDFRYLNTCIIRKPYPLPVIHDVLQSIGTFRWATCIDLNMGYYSMSLNDQAKKYCVTSLPWGLYRYNMLLMSLVIASDVFQAEMGTLFVDMENLLVYIDDILVISTNTVKPPYKVHPFCAR